MRSAADTQKTMRSDKKPIHRGEWAFLRAARRRPYAPPAPDGDTHALSAPAVGFFRAATSEVFDLLPQHAAVTLEVADLLPPPSPPLPKGFSGEREGDFFKSPPRMISRVSLRTHPYTSAAKFAENLQHNLHSVHTRISDLGYNICE